VWKELMIALGLWKAPPKPVAVSAPMILPDCRLGGRPIRRVIKQHRAQLARCYNRVVQFRGGSEGTAMLHFMIAADGTVHKVSVGGSITDVRIRSCLVDVTKSLRFPPDDYVVRVNYPLHFQLPR
jgi:TonB family protein